MFFLSDEMPFSFDEILLIGAASGGKAIEDTATGNPLTFLTDLAKPLKSLLIPFTPIQEGSGDPSPVNNRPIVPWNGLTVDHISENLWKNNETQSFTRYVKITLSQALPAGTYTFTATVESETTGTECVVGFSKGNNNIIATAKLPKSGRHSATFTVNDTVDTVYMYADIDYAPSAGLNATYSGILIEEGTDAPERHTATFPSPVYGGTLDVVSGVLTVEWCGIVKTWSEGTNASTASGYTRKSFTFPVPVRGVNGQYFAQQKCNIAKLEWSVDRKTHFYIDDSTAYLWLPEDTDADQEIQFVSKLVTPQEIQLTPQQITAIKGNNTVWSDANGEMTAVYLKKA